MKKHLYALWMWFYTDVPAYYSIPFIGFVIVVIVGALTQ